MKHEIKKSSYAVIPAPILYHAKLNDKDKILYAHITNLCNEKGYCWASNGYIASLLGKSIPAIKKSLKRLHDLNLISINHVAKNEQDERRISLNFFPVINEEKEEGGGGSKSSYPQLENDLPGGSKSSHIIYKEECTKTNITPPIPPQSCEPEGGAKREERVVPDYVHSEEKAEARRVASMMIKSIRDVKSDWKAPKSPEQFVISVDHMLKLDERTADKILEVFRWALADSFWADKFFKPNPAKYLREKFDQLEMKMNAKPPVNPNKVDRRTKNMDGTPVDAPHLKDLF